MNILRKKLNQGVVIFDGGMGSELYKRNFFVNNSYEQLNLARPEVISEIHASYLQAGAEVLTTNTFNGNARSLGRFGLADKLEAINRAGVKLAKETAGNAALVAGSIGPVCEPLSDSDTRTGAELLKEQIASLDEADFLLFESLRSEKDLQAVLEAISAFPDRTYVPSFAVPAENVEKTFKRYMELVNGAAVPPAAIGLNCGAGPEPTLKALEILAPLTRLPLIVQPNAGSPRGIDGRSLYMTTPEYFTTYALRYLQLGAAAVGGCCGIGPELIKVMAAAVKPMGKAAHAVLPKVEVKEGELPPPAPREERSALGAKLAKGEFVHTIELTPGAGFDVTKLLANARLCKEHGIDAVNLPDGPRASARITPLIAAMMIERETGIATIPHCCCRDRSLIGLQAELLSYAAAGIHNLLFITGDPPKLGDYPDSTGVFDIDSIGLCAMQSRMNRGVDAGGNKLNTPTKVLIGIGVDPNAIDPEREYRRTCEKAEAGADFIQTQPVFDPEMLFKFLRRIEHLHLPVIAGLWPLVSLRNAIFMRDEVPGVVVPDAVMKKMASSESREGQLESGIEIARSALELMRSVIAGVELSAPFGKVETALKVIGRI